MFVRIEVIIRYTAGFQKSRCSTLCRVFDQMLPKQTFFKEIGGLGVSNIIVWLLKKTRSQ